MTTQDNSTLNEQQAAERMASLLNEGNGQLSDHVRGRLAQARQAAVAAASAKAERQQRNYWLPGLAVSCCAALLAIVLLFNGGNDSQHTPASEQIAEQNDVNNGSESNSQLAVNYSAEDPYAASSVDDLLVAEEDLDFLIWLDERADES